jgi:hypothetical protein
VFRNHDPHPERFVLRHLRDARGVEKTVMYPPKDENPTAIYDGLQSLTPHVRLCCPIPYLLDDHIPAPSRKAGRVV